MSAQVKAHNIHRLLEIHRQFIASKCSITFPHELHDFSFSIKECTDTKLSSFCLRIYGLLAVCFFGCSCHHFLDMDFNLPAHNWKELFLSNCFHAGLLLSPCWFNVHLPLSISSFWFLNGSFSGGQGQSSISPQVCLAAGSRTRVQRAFSQVSHAHSFVGHFLLTPS